MIFLNPRFSGKMLGYFKNVEIRGLGAEPSTAIPVTRGLLANEPHCVVCNVYGVVPFHYSISRDKR